jgi:hypothetical protein
VFHLNDQGPHIFFLLLDIGSTPSLQHHLQVSAVVFQLAKGPAAAAQAPAAAAAGAQ